MKKIIAAALTAILICLPNQFAFAQMNEMMGYSVGGSNEDFEYEIFENGTVKIHKYFGNAASVEIPEEIDGCAVTDIANGVFRERSNLVSVILPDSVKKIDGYAFFRCENLSNIRLSNSLTYIGMFAFVGCNALTEITIPQSVTEIAGDSFGGCKSLNNIYVDSNNQYFSSAEGLLYDKEKTKLLQCPAGKTGDIVIPDGVVTIEGWAFESCENVSSVTVPESVTEMFPTTFGAYYNTIVVTPGSYAETYVKKEKLKYRYLNSNVIIDPSKVTEDSDNKTKTISIGDVYADQNNTYVVADETSVIFTGAKNKEIKNVVIPPSITIHNKPYVVKAISNRCFENTKIEHITMSSNIQSIGMKAFYNCKKLKKITIPSGVSKIGNQAFGNCRKLKNITLKTTKLTKKNVGKKAFKGIYKKAVVKAPKKKLMAYRKLFQSKGAGGKVRYK